MKAAVSSALTTSHHSTTLKLQLLLSSSSVKCSSSSSLLYNNNYQFTNHNRTFSTHHPHHNNTTTTTNNTTNTNNNVNGHHSNITARIKYLHKDYRKSNSINESHNTFDIEYNKIRQSLLQQSNPSNSSSINTTTTLSNPSNPSNPQQQLNSIDKDDDEQNIILLSQGYSLGKAYKYEKEGDDEKLYGGEDAFFIQDNNRLTCKNNPYGVNYKNSIQSIGVADGVGGWSDIGHDASLISRQLMQNCFFYSLFNGNLFFNFFKNNNFNSSNNGNNNINGNSSNNGNNSSKYLIEKSFQDIKEKKQVIAGSTTCCVLTLYKDELNTANIGDSGFLILRLNEKTMKYEILSKSYPQQHYHNAPYQLSIIPQYLKGKFEDSPSDAICSTIKVLNNDLIVLASDGLFDNLYDHDIIQFINQNFKVMNEFQLAKNLVLYARNIAFGFDFKNSTPFQDQSEKNGFYYLGGKPDDITVVIARVLYL